MSFLCFSLPAPPSAPRIYLQIPADQESGPWALYCFTGGFHPSNLTITWTYLSAAADIDHLSATNCALPAIDHRRNLSGRHADGTLLASDWSVNSMPPNQSQCFQMTDAASRDVFLFSVVYLAERKSLHTGITFRCEVHGHPAITSPLNASFTWGKQRTALNLFSKYNYLRRLKTKKPQRDCRASGN